MSRRSRSRSSTPRVDSRDGESASYGQSMAMIVDALSVLDEALHGMSTSDDAVQGAAIDPSLRGLIVTAQDVQRLVTGAWIHRSPGPNIAGTLYQRIAPHLESASTGEARSPLQVLRERFALSTFELECLLVCVAADVDTRYEKIFGYLNDDVTRRYPSTQLLLRLLVPNGEMPLRYRRFLMPDGKLRRASLLTSADDPRAGALPYLARCLRVDDGVVRFLLEEARLDAALDDLWDETEFPDAATALWEPLAPVKVVDEVVEEFARASGQRERLVCVLEGRPGAGRRYAAERGCAGHGLGLLPVDCRRLVKQEAPREVIAQLFRDSVLYAAPLYLAHADVLFEDHDRGAELRRELERMTSEHGWLTFVALETRRVQRRWPTRFPNVTVVFPETSVAERAEQWRVTLPEVAEHSTGAADGRAHLCDELATKFRLTPGQIALAAQRVQFPAPMDRHVPIDELAHRAAGRVAAPVLNELADRIVPVHRRSDFVASPRVQQQLDDVLRQMRYRRVVLEQWGLGERLTRGKGLNVLLAGPSGSGKTMAAEVLARELKMELYRIDLATVISKYIGETEKNLSRIFHEAEHSDAILFFDEADALFGKRSEIRDSHDRYANIEINHLLQLMEGYRGIAILATNMRRHLDEAFLRRLHVVIECPIPAPDERLRIWSNVLPARASKAADLDLRFLARSFELTGGNIANAGLSAAFLAAEAGGTIEMRHLVRATHMELDKIGRRTIAEEFGPYYPLVAAPGASPA